jgi:hypothetical protein
LVIVGVLSKRRGRALRTPTTPRPASASASAMTPTVRLSLNYCSRASLSPRMVLLLEDARAQWVELDRRISESSTSSVLIQSVLFLALLAGVAELASP